MARTKLSKLEHLAKQVQDHASQIALHRSEDRNTEAELIGQDELDGLSTMLEDYIEKLTKKREEFDELVEEQRQMLEVAEGTGSWKVGEQITVFMYYNDFVSEFTMCTRQFIQQAVIIQ